MMRKQVIILLLLKRIVSGWARTMPAKLLLEELLHKSKGRVIMMNEDGINQELSAKLRAGFSSKELNEKYTGTRDRLYVEYTITKL